MKTLIIQSSFPRSASTLLVNALYGLVPALRLKKVQWHDFQRDSNFNSNSDILIIKTHDRNIDELTQRLQNKYNLFFICSERTATGSSFPDRYRTYDNVAIFDYADLNETAGRSLPVIAATIYNKVRALIPGIPLSKMGCLARIMAMNERYAEIEEEPFDFVDPFFQLHGSHRRRPMLRGGYGF
jgi:hypothetical protein